LPYHRPERFRLAMISLVISVALAIAIIFQVRDRWNQPEVKTTTEAEHSTTGAVVRDAGARLSPTDPKLSIEPTPAGPKPVQPADRPEPHPE
jgi:hypothetical protein